VFVPLTKLCRDVCHYCTFAERPRNGRSPYLSLGEVLEIANQGKRAGCREVLFTLGDRPEARYEAARNALGALGHESTLGYLAEAARREGLAGLVRNLDDGRVEAVAEGEAESVVRFERAVRQGPSRARVEYVIVEDTEPPATRHAFLIED